MRTNENGESAFLWKVVNSVVNALVKLLSRLPSQSGDLLNGVIDLIAFVALMALWKSGILPANQWLLSFVILLGFLLLCFAGAMFVRIIKRTAR